MLLCAFLSVGNCLDLLFCLSVEWAIIPILLFISEMILTANNDSVATPVCTLAPFSASLFLTPVDLSDSVWVCDLGVNKNHRHPVLCALK